MSIILIESTCLSPYYSLLVLVYRDKYHRLTVDQQSMSATIQSHQTNKAEHSPLLDNQLACCVSIQLVQFVFIPGILFINAFSSSSMSVWHSAYMHTLTRRHCEHYIWVYWHPAGCTSCAGSLYWLYRPDMQCNGWLYNWGTPTSQSLLIRSVACDWRKGSSFKMQSTFQSAGTASNLALIQSSSATPLSLTPLLSLHAFSQTFGIMYSANRELATFQGYSIRMRQGIGCHRRVDDGRLPNLWSLSLFNFNRGCK